MERDCQHGLYKAGMGSSRVLSDFAEKYGSKNRVLAGFGIGGKSGKEKVSALFGGPVSWALISMRDRIYRDWPASERSWKGACSSGGRKAEGSGEPRAKAHGSWPRGRGGQKAPSIPSPNRYLRFESHHASMEWSMLVLSIPFLSVDISLRLRKVSYFEGGLIDSCQLETVIMKKKKGKKECQEEKNCGGAFLVHSNQKHFWMAYETLYLLVAMQDRAIIDIIV
ncbi:hypothetical protein Tco_0123731 [Tanacetum coccineum]